ncbi:MAG: polysaccharide deacetylase family protein [Anaerolineae bacterium]|nr:polysaccharide deacetylase family protein [Anaerolineae bacterium]
MPTIGLMYHDVYRDTPYPGIGRSAALYHISIKQFQEQLSVIRTSELLVKTAGQAASGGEGDCAIITFDDGWRGSFDHGLPVLREYGYPATFFITKDFVGRDGFAGEAEIRAAAQAGMEIGVHGTSHRMLSACSFEEIVREFAECRQYLEDLTGQEARSASMPGGDWNKMIVAAARQAGIALLYTSRAGINRARANPYYLRRVSIREDSTQADLERYCQFNTRKEATRWMIFQFPRQVLGMRAYSVLRRWLLGESRGQADQLFSP